MDPYRRLGVLLWLFMATGVWLIRTRGVDGKPTGGSTPGRRGTAAQKHGVAKKFLKPCTKTLGKQVSDLQKGSNGTRRARNALCSKVNIPQVEIVPEKPIVTMASKQEVVTKDTIGSDASSSSSSSSSSSYPVTESALGGGPAKEDLSGGKTGLNSDELHRSEPGEEEEELVDSLAPRPPYPEMDAGLAAPSTEQPATNQAGRDIASNDHVPNEKKSKLFIDTGLFPFIAMGVLSALFITMMMAALYFARHSADVHHGQLGIKPGGFGGHQGPYGMGNFNAVAFRNAQDAVIGDFAVNMFAVRQEEREEATRELTESIESSLLPSPAKAAAITAQRAGADPPPAHGAGETGAEPLDLPDVVSRCSSTRRDGGDSTAASSSLPAANRHSTGSSLYMELVNMCRNARLLEELALRKKGARLRDALQIEDSRHQPGDEAKRPGDKLALRKQRSLDSDRYRDSVPLPYSYESHYYKLYDDDDDDDEGCTTPATLTTSPNTTMDTFVLSSCDEGYTAVSTATAVPAASSVISAVARPGKRAARPAGESPRLLLPVREFFNEALVGSSDYGAADGGGGEVLYETIDEMGYRRRTASSRAIRELMAARELAGGRRARDTVVVESAWEPSTKCYDRIDRSIKAYRKQSKKALDYNTLVV